jgi:hypothetical protein
MDEAIEKDKKDHPECQYSTMSQQLYSMVNGKSSQEVIKTAVRHCPNERPKTVFEERNSTEGGSGSGDCSSSGSGITLWGDGAQSSQSRVVMPFPGLSTSKENSSLEDAQAKALAEIVGDLFKGFLGVGVGVGVGEGDGEGRGASNEQHQKQQRHQHGMTRLAPGGARDPRGSRRARADPKPPSHPSDRPTGPVESI